MSAHVAYDASVVIVTDAAAYGDAHIWKYSFISYSSCMFITTQVVLPYEISASYFYTPGAYGTGGRGWMGYQCVVLIIVKNLHSYGCSTVVFSRNYCYLFPVC